MTLKRAIGLAMWIVVLIGEYVLLSKVDVDIHARNTLMIFLALILSALTAYNIFMDARM